MNFGTIAGTISTAIFMLSQIPMLLKAVRSKSLNSYSLANIMMSAAGNLIHWCYISTLPFGPIWFLHSFSSLSATLMLMMYLRFEKGSRSTRSVENPIRSAQEDRMKKNLSTGQASDHTSAGKELSEFHKHYRPHIDAIYRNALIMTGNPRHAERLQDKIYMKAFMLYLQQTGSSAGFEDWLREVLTECVAELGHAMRGKNSRQEHENVVASGTARYQTII